MWRYHSRQSFTASHALTHYLGQPEPSHSHEWSVAAVVTAARLGPEHYGLDFHAVHDHLEQVVAPLRDSDLSAHPEIGTPSATAENLALFVWSALRPEIEDLGGRLERVSVWEGPENRVDYDGPESDTSPGD